ncbi:hypothetical protein QLX67_13505, partial [Balneolaceae bacterium ANBcel3]|nr:hypothetical protein [Balneolaceae bacterium ANBcel3]
MVTRQINFKSWLTIGMFFLLVVGLYILFLPIIIIAIPFLIWSYFDSLAFNKKYNDYLQTISGTNFFCYNNRTNSKDYIEKNILPTLSTDIKVIFLDGKTPKSEYDQRFISKALYSIKDRKGFPYLLKISDGQIIDKSINNDFYNTMNQNKDI